MAEAAKAAGVKHVIWSTLEDTRKFVPLSDNRMPTLQGKYKVPHFDAKGEADEQFTKLGLPVTFLLTSFYWDNAIYFGMGPKRGADGKLRAHASDGRPRRLAGIAAGDIGKCAYGIFKDGTQWIGKTVGIAGEHLTGAQMAAGYSKALGDRCTTTPSRRRPTAASVSRAPRIWATCSSSIADFEDYFWQVAQPGNFPRLEPRDAVKFDVWLAENKSRIPLD